jgi:anti-sigma factor RsiW
VSTSEPRPGQLEAMAYVDGELDRSAAQAFEARMSTDRALALEVSELQALDLLARGAAPPEPADSEWRRIEEDLAHQGGLAMSWVLLTVGAIGMLGYWCYAVTTSDMPMVGVLLFLAGILGFTGVLALTLRERMRITPFDPYRKVQR